MSDDDMEARLRDLLAANPHGALAAYLFGSFARGEAREESDIDVAVLYAAPVPSTLDAPHFALEADLEQALGRQVQVVVLNTAPSDLVHRVFRDGKIVLDRDRGMRIAFEVRARNEYFDMDPILRQYRRQPERRT